MEFGCRFNLCMCFEFFCMATLTESNSLMKSELVTVWCSPTQSNGLEELFWLGSLNGVCVCVILVSSLSFLLLTFQALGGVSPPTFLSRTLERIFLDWIVWNSLRLVLPCRVGSYPKCQSINGHRMSGHWAEQMNETGWKIHLSKKKKKPGIVRKWFTLNFLRGQMWLPTVSTIWVHFLCIIDSGGGPPAFCYP